MTQSEAILVAAIVNAIVVVGGFVYTHVNRKKDFEEQTAHLDKQIDLTRLELEVKAMDAASAAKEAYHEANSVNRKIADLQKQLEERTLPPAASPG